MKLIITATVEGYEVKVHGEEIDATSAKQTLVALLGIKTFCRDSIAEMMKKPNQNNS